MAGDLAARPNTEDTSKNTILYTKIEKAAQEALLQFQSGFGYVPLSAAVRWNENRYWAVVV
jgi:hypothetical protein